MIAGFLFAAWSVSNDASCSQKNENATLQGGTYLIFVRCPFGGIPSDGMIIPHSSAFIPSQPWLLP